MSHQNDDTLALALIAAASVLAQAAIAGAVTVILAVLQGRTKAAVDHAAAESARRGEAAAEKVAEVKTAARASDEKLDGLADVAKATHTLVNSEHGKALQAVADLARWKASQTRASADDLAASAAERALADHQSKQARVDRGGAK